MSTMETRKHSKRNAHAIDGETPTRPKRDAGRDRDSIRRKREQNRVSQQCFREKNRSHAKQLESLGELIKSSAQSSTLPSAEQYNALLKKQFDLVKENGALRDCLLRMRRKLLSISTASAAAADDSATAELLFAKPSPNKRSSHSNPPRRVEPSRESSFHSDTLSAEDNTLIGNEILMQQISSVASANACSLPSDNSLSDLDLNIVGTISSPRPTSDNRQLPFLATAPSSLKAGCEAPHISSTDTAFSDFIPPVIPSFGSSIPTATPLCFSTCFPEQTSGQSSVQSHWQFEPDISQAVQRTFELHTDDYWTVEEACLRYLVELKNEDWPLTAMESVHNLWPLRSVPSEWNTIRLRIAASGVEDDTIDSIIRVGIELICKSSGLDSYIYGVGGNNYMEKILRWRLCPTPRNRFDIPEPFYPTTLQTTSCNTHCPVIDMLNWPSIRDQLIQQAGTYDLDAVISDIVEHTVIEVPGLGIAISVHDTFCTQVFPQITSVSSYSDEADTDDTPLPKPYDVPSVLRKITRYMQNTADNQSSSPSTSSSGQSQTIGFRQSLASKWGLDMYLDWKLSREFAATHPFLDCTQVTASCPMYSSKYLSAPP